MGGTYYYSGKKPEETKEKTEDTEMEKFVGLKDVQWNLLKNTSINFKIEELWKY